MEDMSWDWPEWKDPEAWEDIPTVKVWRDVLGDRLIGLPARTMRDLYDSVLERFYYGPLVAQLNDTTPLLNRIGVPGLTAPYVPPRWHIRKYRRFRTWALNNREAFGRWVGGIEADDYDEYE